VLVERCTFLTPPRKEALPMQEHCKLSVTHVARRACYCGDGEFATVGAR
jgi:hypothetical protein